jgi:hypothetical protein
MNHSLVQQANCKFKMVKCNWNVIKSNNNHNVGGVKKDKISSCGSLGQMIDVGFDSQSHQTPLGQ